MFGPIHETYDIFFPISIIKQNDISNANYPYLILWIAKSLIAKNNDV